MLSRKELIVGTLTGVSGNIVYAVLQELAKNTSEVSISFVQVLCSPIPLWYFLVTLLVAGMAVWGMHVYSRHQKPAFLNRTGQVEQGLEFQWIWVKNEKTGKYEMKDFWPICPYCHEQLRMELYDPIKAYHCTNGHVQDIHITLNKKRDLLHKLKQEFKAYSDRITYSEI